MSYITYDVTDLSQPDTSNYSSNKPESHRCPRSEIVVRFDQGWVSDERELKARPCQRSPPVSPNLRSPCSPLASTSLLPNGVFPCHAARLLFSSSSSVTPIKLSVPTSRHCQFSPDIRRDLCFQIQCNRHPTFLIVFLGVLR